MASDGSGTTGTQMKEVAPSPSLSCRVSASRGALQGAGDRGPPLGRVWEGSAQARRVAGRRLALHSHSLVPLQQAGAARRQRPAGQGGGPRGGPVGQGAGRAPQVAGHQRGVAGAAVAQRQHHPAHGGGVLG